MRSAIHTLRLSLAAAAVAALAAGCSLAPRFERPDPSVPDAYPNGTAYGQQPAAGADGRSAQGRPATEIGWRDFFNDPRLQRLVELSLQNNRDLRVSVLNIEAAQAQYQITRAGLFPTLSANAGLTRTRTPLDLTPSPHAISSQYTVGLGASWVIDFFGRVSSLRDQALAQYLATAEARKSAELALVATVANQYLTLLAVDDALVVTRNTLKTAEDSLQLAQVQFDAGTGNELTLRQAQTVVSQARANLQVQERSRAQAQNALALLVGQPLPADLPAGLPLASESILTDIPEGLPSDLIARRPDIASAEQGLRGANANIGAARAAYFPTISITGAFGTLAPEFSGLFDSGSSSWSFAPKVNVPIFAGGINTANLNLAKVQQRIAVERYQKTVQSAFREIADELAARGTYDQQITELKTLTSTQQRRLELSDLRFRSGVDSYLTVLTAQNDYYSAQQSLINAQLQRLVNLVDLYQSLGGGWIERSGDEPRPSDAPAAWESSSDKG
jgi:multidrug efflux system outer membrane protein